MIITRYLPDPCPACGKKGGYGNVNVTNDTLNRGCTYCGKWVHIPLPKLNKKIIYLDQFFLSHAFRKGLKEFIDASDKIQNLAKNQLLVCPWSTIHRLETHLWRNPNKYNLWNFIKHTAKGNKFTSTYHIKSMQTQRAFNSFINSSNISQEILLKDAFNGEINKWDDYYWIDVSGYCINNTENIRKNKEEAVSLLVDSFDDWMKTESSFKEDVIEEANGYARSLMQLYSNSMKLLRQGSFMEYLFSPMDSDLIKMLLHKDNKTMSWDNRINRLNEFLHSHAFRSIPYIDISCRLFSILRRRVKEGSYSNRNKAKDKLLGITYDIDAISIYGPYCDAIVIDKAMHKFITSKEGNILHNYQFEVFSSYNLDKFNSYLDGIENDCPDIVKEYLLKVYN